MSLLSGIGAIASSIGKGLGLLNSAYGVYSIFKGKKVTSDLAKSRSLLEGLDAFDDFFSPKKAPPHLQWREDFLVGLNSHIQNVARLDPAFAQRNTPHMERTFEKKYMDLFKPPKTLEPNEITRRDQRSEFEKQPQSEGPSLDINSPNTESIRSDE